MKQKISENLVHPTNDELKQLQKFDYKEVMKGISVEKEHTKDERVAARIALDHLKENPQYYRELAKAQIEDVMSYDFFAILESDDDEDTPLGSWGARPQHKEVVTPTKSPKKDTRSSPALQYKVSPTSGRAIWDPKSGMSKTEFFSAVRAAKNRKDGRLIHLDSTRKREPDSGKVKTPLGSFPSRVAVSSRGNIVTRQDRVTRENDIKTTEPDSVDKIIRASLEADRLRKIKWTQTARRVKRERKTISLPSNTDNNMNNESIKEEVFKSLNEFFGSNFRPSGTFKAQPKGTSNTRYSWTASPKNKKIGGKGPKEPAERSGPSVTDRVKGWFRNRADSKQRKIDDASKIELARGKANTSNAQSIANAFKGYDRMAPSKSKGDVSSFEHPSILKKNPAFKVVGGKAKEPSTEKTVAPTTHIPAMSMRGDASTPEPPSTGNKTNYDVPSFTRITGSSGTKTTNPRESGAVNPNFEKQNAVERASKAALELGKARAAGKLHNEPPPEPKTEAPRRQPPPPPKPTKLLTAASRFTIKKGEAEAKAVLPSSGKVILAGPVSSAKPEAEAPSSSPPPPPKPPRKPRKPKEPKNSEEPKPPRKPRKKVTEETSFFFKKVLIEEDPDYDTPTFLRNKEKEPKKATEPTPAFPSKPKVASTARFKKERAVPKGVNVGGERGNTFDTALDSEPYVTPTDQKAVADTAAKERAKGARAKEIETRKSEIATKRAEAARTRAEKASARETAKRERETKSATRRAEIEADRNARAQQRMRVAGINADIAKQRIGAQKSNMVKAAASKAASVGKATIVGMVKNLANTAKSLTHSKVNVNV